MVSERLTFGMLLIGIVRTFLGFGWDLYLVMERGGHDRKYFKHGPVKELMFDDI